MPRVIQNVDVAATTKHYANVEGLLVTSIFRTLQGEAPFSGWPAVFLRLAGCNLGKKEKYCQFCDTSFQLENATHYTQEALYEALEAQQEGHDILVLTGGEPSLQHRIIPVLQKLLEDNVYRLIQIESNLTNPAFYKELAAALEPKGLLTKNVNGRGVYIVGSPKANYVSGKTPRPHPEVEKLVGTFKFLIGDSDTPHTDIPDWAYELPKDKVYLSPLSVYAKPYAGEVSSIWEEGLINKELTSANYTRAAELCIKHSFKLSLQTHLFVAIA